MESTTDLTGMSTSLLVHDGSTLRLADFNLDIKVCKQVILT